MAVDGWQESYLEDLADEITVGHVGPMASEYVVEGVPFLRSQNVEPLRINDNDRKFISETFHKRLRKSALAPGDVVIVRTGKPGACAVIPDSLPVANCSDLVIVRCGANLDARFLSYYVNSVAAHHIGSHLVGAVQQHFNVGSARRMLLLLPPVTEQRAITHILGTLDDKIELNRRMNETLEAMARALFKSWFVDFDPVRAKAEGRDTGLAKHIADCFPDSFEETEIPKGWEVQQIGRLADIVGGGTPSTKEPVYWECGKHHWATPKDLSALSVPVPGVSNLFLLLWARHSHEEIVSRANGSTFLEISKSNFRPIPLVAPTPDVMKVFDAFVRPPFERIVECARESNTLAVLRDTLLPKLISGELRVNDAEKQLEDAI